MMKPMNAAGDGRKACFERALILGGGGMFGAYQAGVWDVIQCAFEPDVVVGASIGAINGWAIAGGCSGAELVEMWLDLREAATPAFRFPRSISGGCVERAEFERFMRRHYERFKQKTAFAAVVTRLPGLEPEVVVTPGVTWQHLAASCAVPFIMPSYRVDGRISADGGLLGALPMWAAARLGARRAVGVNVLPRSAPLVLRGARWFLKTVSGFRPGVPERGTSEVIEHERPLGSLWKTARWSRDDAERLIEFGRQDARAAMPRIERMQEASGHQTI